MRYLAFVLLATAACQAQPAVPAAPSAAPTAELIAAGPSAEAPAAFVATSPSPCAPTTSKSRISVGGKSIPVDLAFTDASRQKGLSGRPCLAEGTGLVLGWDQPTPARIWMPDMNFAIDVVFVRDAKIVMIKADAQPCPSMNDCPTFGPGTAVDYVLEVPAGSMKAWGVKQGDAIKLTK